MIQRDRICSLVDADDERAILMAMAKIQASPMFLLPEGESDTAGGLLVEICRQWLDARRERPGVGEQ